MIPLILCALNDHEILGRLPRFVSFCGSASNVSANEDGREYLEPIAVPHDIGSGGVRRSLSRCLRKTERQQSLPKRFANLRKNFIAGVMQTLLG